MDVNTDIDGDDEIDLLDLEQLAYSDNAYIIPIDIDIDINGNNKVNLA